jgi:DNA polymerase-3 subunit delta'
MTPSSKTEAPPVETPHPRETALFFGHAEAEQELLAAYRSGRIPHAWLIGGPPGIGKATLAFRAARFILAHPDPASPAVQSARSLAIDPEHPVARRVAIEAHGDLLSLERRIGDSGKLRTEIAVEDVRRTVTFFGSTAGEGGWRICVVDSADELNRAGANALLKVLEEPPAKSLLLLVSHAPGRLLPTLRSRCCLLRLRPLGEAEVARAAAALSGTDPQDPAIAKAVAAAEGSVARALALSGGRLLEFRKRVAGLLQRLPATDARSLHALGDTLDRADWSLFDAFVDSAREWLSSHLTAPAKDLAALDRVAEAWERLNGAAAEVEAFNLDRKSFVFTAFGWLAETARG